MFRFFSSALLFFCSEQRGAKTSATLWGDKSVISNHWLTCIKTVCLLKTGNRGMGMENEEREIFKMGKSLKAGIFKIKESLKAGIFL